MKKNVRKQVTKAFLQLCAWMAFLFLCPTAGFAQNGYWTDEGNYDPDWPTDHMDGDTYVILDEKDLAAFANKIIYHASLSDEFENKTIEIRSNLDLGEHYWIPIAGYQNNAEYAGILKGNNRTISNMTIKVDDDFDTNGGVAYIGLIGTNEGEIRNLNFLNPKIVGSSNIRGWEVGIIAGENRNTQNSKGKGLIENCTVSGSENPFQFTLTASSFGSVRFGGICGDNYVYATVQNCTVDIPLSFEFPDEHIEGLGGITGYNGGKLIDCTNKKPVTGSTGSSHYDKYINGIAGQNKGTITNCQDLSSGGGEEETPVDGEFAVDQLKYKITSANTVCFLGPDVKNNDEWTARTCAIPATVTNGGKSYTVTEIANEAFYGCESVEEISIPETVIKIGMGDEQNSGAFVGIKSLKKMTVASSNPAYTTQDGILYTKDKSTLLLCPAQLTASTLTLPTGVKRIEAEAFAYCANIQELVMPEGLTHVMWGAFESDGNEEVQWKTFRFPSTIQFLDEMLFDDLDRGLEIYCASTNPSAITIGEGVFADIDTASVLYVPKGTKELYASLPQWKEFKRIKEEGEDQPVSDPSDATLKSLSYKIEENGAVMPVPGFSPEVYRYEIGYKTNDEYVDAGGNPRYPAGACMFPIGVATNEKAKVTATEVLLPFGFAKVAVTSENSTQEKIYSIFLKDQRDAAKKYILLSLDHLSVQINGETYRNGSFYTASTGENVTLQFIPDKGYKLSGINIDEGETVSMVSDLSGTIELKMDWHKVVSVSTVESSEEDGLFVFNGLKYRVTGANTVSVMGPDVAEDSGNDSWTVTNCVIPASVTYKGVTYRVTTIEDEAFSGAENMKSITLPEGLQTIGCNAFYRCYGLTSLHIPASVTSIGNNEDEAFFAKLDIESLTVAEGNKNYSAERNMLFDKAKSRLLWAAYFNRETEVELPGTVTAIRAYAFAYQDHLTSVTLPASLKTIGDYAFLECSGLTAVYFKGNQPPVLGNGAFEDTDLNALTVYVPKGCKEAYEKVGVFKNIVEEGGGTEEPEQPTSFTVGKLKYTVIGKNEVAISGVTDKTPTYYDIKQTVTYENTVYKVTTVGKEAFKGCTNLTRFNPESIHMVIDVIEEGAFSGCSKLTNLLFSEGLKTIGDRAFEGCSSLGSVEIPASVTRIGADVFKDCINLSQIRVKTANQQYTSVKGLLFNREKTTLLVYPNKQYVQYTMPQGVKRIESHAFYNCPDLKKIFLPASLESVGTEIFGRCEKTLEEVHCSSATPLNVSSNAFFASGASTTCKLYVPRGSKAKYQSATGWKVFKEIIEEGAEIPFEPEVEEVSDSTLTITWESVPEATVYEVNVYSDEDMTQLVKTLRFDANGQPLRAAGNFSYKLDGLAAGTNYYIQTKAIQKVNGKETVLAEGVVSVKTTGTPTANESIAPEALVVLARDGQIFVQSQKAVEVRIYNLSGFCVKVDKVSGYRAYQVPEGVYVVVAGGARYKVMVR